MHLGKTSGKANIENNLQQLGIQLSDEDLKKVTQRIIELGDRKEMVTQADLPYIISDVLDSNTIEEKVQIENYVLTHSKNLRPICYIKNYLSMAKYLKNMHRAMDNTMHL